MPIPRLRTTAAAPLAAVALLLAGSGAATGSHAGPVPDDVQVLPYPPCPTRG
ncbi:hypothetical protein ABT093_18380 [Kitasatospora sp. NPDC002551]|uniref:hypothetical protein n=1 Tax=Kitasatospora sp. NPDC002551 TaxID=3154539 RepID=UPI0033199294